MRSRRSPARDVPRRRHGQRLRDDRADDGDDARLRDDRRRSAAGAAATARCVEACDDTFNAITVDGECSTNDCVLLLANGASGVTIDEAQLPGARRGCGRSAASWRSASSAAAKARPSSSPSPSPARATADEARRRRSAIANSPLVKTAIHGGDPNWGRLVAAAGRAGVAFELERARCTIGASCCSRTGGRTTSPRRRRRSTSRTDIVDVEVDLGAAAAPSSTIWTCDLSAEYVRINANTEPEPWSHRRSRCAKDFLSVLDLQAVGSRALAAISPRR